MNQEFLLTGLDKQKICEALGCNDKATNEIKINAGQNSLISLFVCERCTHNFISVSNTILSAGYTK